MSNELQELYEKIISNLRAEKDDVLKCFYNLSAKYTDLEEQHDLLIDEFQEERKKLCKQIKQENDARKRFVEKVKQLKEQLTKKDKEIKELKNKLKGNN